MMLRKLIISGFVVLTLAGCGAMRSGGYYEDDGPGARVPSDAELAAIPDAVPRKEAVHKRSLKAYRVGRKWYRPLSPRKSYRQKGIASWYGRKFHGHKTAIGERYNMYAMTAAHRTLPLPSYVRVTNRKTGQSAIVRVNDRGPFKKNRIIDLSYTAAKKLGVLATGTAPVTVELIKPGQWRQASKKTPAPSQTQKKAAIPTLSPEPAPAKKRTIDMAQTSFTGSAEPVLPESGIYVQTGVFSVWKNASGLKAKLLLKGLQPVHMRHQQMDKGVLYRVLMGPYVSEKQAREMVSKVKSSGISGARVVSF
ncbi:MAG: septal ring lytic transglycosylase RlpA family lipoprotein [Gammaproteobacteria bacterium]|nr:MAG: septal ring lytic transglycosylase RlpA family lipoprotein [Gammaproteobacteria bacterium]